MNELFRGATILVADDDPLFCSLLCHMVEVLGLKVAGKAFDGNQAIEMCRTARPDLVLMDIMMPGLDGINAGEVIRAEHGIPIVFVSGFFVEDVCERALAAGAAGFLRKPFMLDDLRTVLEPHVSKQGFAAKPTRLRW